jgi:hypothetical protein
MKRKEPLKTSLMFLLVAFLIIFAAGAFVANMDRQERQKITADTIAIDSNNVIRVPNSHQPVPNTQEGTISLWTKPAVEIFDQFSDARDYIVFFSATNMPGLRVVYNIKAARFEAGTPLMASPKIDIFDKQNHHFVYMFRKGGEQKIYLDGVQVKSSDFRPIEKDMVVGLSIYELEDIEEVEIKGIEVAQYDRFMTADDLKKI